MVSICNKIYDICKKLIEAKSKHKMELKPIDADTYHNKSTLLLAGSGSGKTTFLKNIMKELSPRVPVCFAICGTDSQNGSFSGGRVPVMPKPFVFPSIDPKWLADFWERQEAISSAYKKAANLKLLCGLVERHGPLSVKEFVQRANSAMKAQIKDAEKRGANAEQLEELSTVTERSIVRVIRKWMSDKRRELVKKMDLSEDEKCAIHSVDLNPDVLLIFDDVTESIEANKKNVHLSNILTKGRHNNITLIICGHTDKAFNKEMRSYFHNTVWLSQKSLSDYIGRNCNDKDEKRDHFVAGRHVNWDGHEKLMYIRLSGAFSRVKAEKDDNFQFGSDKYRKFGKKIASDGDTSMQNNKFYSEMMSRIK